MDIHQSLILIILNDSCKHNALSIYKELDSEKYQQLHVSLLDQSTASNGKQEQQQAQTEKIDKKVTIKQKELIIHYRFESGPLSKFSGEFRKLWGKNSCYEKSSLNSVRVILGTRSNLSLERLLVKKKPTCVLLRHRDETSETQNNTKPTVMEAQ